MLRRPPVPKFNEQCKTPEPQKNLTEEVLDQIFRMQLGSSIEKRAIKILSQMRLPNHSSCVFGLIYYCMKQERMALPQMTKQIENVVRCIENQQMLLIENLCQRMGFNEKIASVCRTLLSQLCQLIQKLPQQMQNALSVKIATDIIFNQQGGVKTKFIAQHARISEEALKNTIARIQPFSKQIVKDLFDFYNTNPL